MINKRKVRLMARTAMYEKHEGGEDMSKFKYYKTDYVGLHMWNTAIAVTVAYLIIGALVIGSNFESIINNLMDINYTVLAVIVSMLYVALQVSLLLISYFYYSFRYDEAETGIRTYQNRLAKIYHMNEKDMKNKGGTSL